MRSTTLLSFLALGFTAVTATPIPADEFVPESFPLAALENYILTALGETAPVDKRQYSASTVNQLTDGTACRAVTLIYARGTNQAGNIGDAAAVGPLFFNALAKLVGTQNLAVQGVTYAANVLGFLLGGDPAATPTLANLVATAVTQCPNTKIVLSGYSQGAQVIHNGAAKLTAAQTSRIAAVLLFGDPKNGQAVGTVPAAKIKTICHTGDNICEGGIIVSDPHTTYQADAGTAAAWVASKVA